MNKFFPNKQTRGRTNMKKDWHNYAQIAEDNQRTGLLKLSLNLLKYFLLLMVS